MVVGAYDNNMQLIVFWIKTGQNVKKGVELVID